MRTELEDQYRAFVRTAALPLRRFAFLLCGDWHLAEDLTQTAMLKLYRAGPGIQHTGAVSAYARKAVLRCWLSERRRAWRRAENRTGEVPDAADPAADPMANGHALLTTCSTHSPPSRRGNGPCWCCAISKTCPSPTPQPLSVARKALSRARHPAGSPT